MFADLPEALATIAAWMEQQRMDARFDASSFTAFGMRVRTLKNENWEEMTPSELGVVIGCIDRQARPQVLLAPGKDNPATYAFQTRDGRRGILQVLALTEDGVKLRYKLIEPGNAEPFDAQAALDLFQAIGSAEQTLGTFINAKMPPAVAWFDKTLQPKVEKLAALLAGTELDQRTKVLLAGAAACRDRQTRLGRGTNDVLR